MMCWKIPFSYILLIISLSNGYPIAEEETHPVSVSDDSGSKLPTVFDEYIEDELEGKNNIPRSISSNGYETSEKDPTAMISKALEDASDTLGMSIKNLGNSAIQILEGTGVAAEQALGTGARLVTGVAETAAEAAESGAKSAIRIAHGVANSLTHGTRSLVETKTNLLKGLTGAGASGIQADASSNSETVQRQERQSYGGYSTTSSYGAPSIGETPSNFVNVFSQAAANTVNFGTQLLNSLVGVAANILQGTVSTLLSLLNAKGQVVGAVVQSAPPVLASVTRTAGDVLAAKARIFGAVTQAAVSFGNQLAKSFGDTFGGLFNRINNIGGSGDSENISTPAKGLSGILSALGNREGSGYRGLSSILSSFGSRDIGSGPAPGTGLLGGIGNLAQTLINAKLNLINGLLSPFTGGRPLINLGKPGSLFGPSSSSGGYSSASADNTYRISISSTPSSNNNPIISLGQDETASNGPRTVRFNVAPDATYTPKLEDQLSPANLLKTFGSGIFKGFADQLNRNLQSNLKRDTSLKGHINELLGSFDNSGDVPKILPLQSVSVQSTVESQKVSAASSADLKKTGRRLNKRRISKRLRSRTQAAKE